MGIDTLTVEPLNQEDWSGYAALIRTINFLFISNKKTGTTSTGLWGRLGSDISYTEIPTLPDSAEGIS